MKKIVEKLSSKQMLIISGVFLLASFIVEYILPIIGVEFEFVINPAWVSLIISGTPLAYWAAVHTLNKKITSPLLITIAMIAAVYIGDVFAAGEVAFIMALGEWLEDKTVEKAKKGIEKLLSLVPAQGRKINGNEQIIIDAQEIKAGDILRILPGESFPADGVIVSGTTTVDQSIITGESLPVDKSENDEVFTGTINRFGSVDINVTQSYANSSLQKMIKLVQDADAQKAPTQKIVDKWAGYLVPSAIAIAVITYIIFAFVMHMPSAALIRAVTVLVVFCPCALALATPTSIMAAIGQATKNGVLVKSGEALELMGTIKTVAFDKTGTLTYGKLEVSDVIAIEIEEDELLKLASSVESHSEHPIGKAICNYAKIKKTSQIEVTDFSMVPGKGVSASVGEKTIICGNEKMIEEIENLNIDKNTLDKIDSLAKQGKATVIVSNKETILGIIALADKVKENCNFAVSQLNTAGITKTVLLTGDNEKSAQFIAKKVGISDVKASLMPKDKVDAVKEIMQKTGAVCMVGDGVNDAPALKTATVGIAMGSMGSDIAIDAADIAIMGDDISKISYLKKLSRETIYSIKFNIVLAMIINVLAVILSVLGLLNPATGALVHNAGSIIVILNAARLYDKKIV